MENKTPQPDVSVTAVTSRRAKIERRVRIAYLLIAIALYSVMFGAKARAGAALHAAGASTVSASNRVVPK